MREVNLETIIVMLCRGAGFDNSMDSLLSLRNQDFSGNRNVDSTPINTAHTAQYSLFTSAERSARAWL